MNDKELLDFVEQRLFERMLEGCEMCDHLGSPYELGVWSVSFSAGVIARLLDMAKEKT
jgi:hypothetical protein